MIVTNPAPVYRSFIVEIGSFVPGEIVELKSGGSPLTVLDVCDDCGNVDVAYTDIDGDIEILTLPGVALQIYAEEGECPSSIAS